MKITEVTVGISKQVFQIGVPEYWNKVTVTATMDSEVEVVETVIDELHKVCNKAHEKYSAFVEPGRITPKGDIYFNVTTQKEER